MTTTSLFLGILIWGLAAARLYSRNISINERRVIPIALVTHAAAAIAHVWVVRNIYGTGDMTMYWDHGQSLARILQHDPALFWSTAAGLISQRTHTPVPITIHGQGTSTATMSGIAAIFSAILPGPIELTCVLIAMLSVLGKLFIYTAIRGGIPPERKVGVLAFILLLPSSVFWSSALTKEALAMFPLGVAVLGARSLVSGKLLRASALLASGSIGVMLLKPYVVIVLAMATATWFYADRVVRRHGKFQIRPTYLVVSLALGAVGSLALGAAVPRFALSNLADEAARLQEVGTQVEGGSNYSLGTSSDASIAQQTLLAPAALITGLFRPFIFESTTILMLITGAETAVLLLLALRALRRRGTIRILTQSSSAPVLFFCLSFTILMGLAVGLATTNLGTLSRYRSPMAPFMTSALMVLGSARQPLASNKDRPKPPGLLRETTA